MTPSFSSLFDRSRYSGHARGPDIDEAAKKKDDEQKERFASAMIALALKVDPTFRKHFLVSICGLTELADAQDWEILVEPEYWGDLVLKHRASGSLVVIELKIDCKLADHQDPTHPRFYSEAQDGECSGYDWEIEQCAQREHFIDRRYFTIQKTATWSKAVRKNGALPSSAREWRQLLRDSLLSETTMEREIYDCLGNFGVTCFLGRGFNNMNKAKETIDGINLLIAAAAELGLEPLYPHGSYVKARFELGRDAIGVNLLSEDPGMRTLSGRLQDPLGWFGYEKDADEVYLMVWIYEPKEPKSLRKKFEEFRLPKSRVIDDGPGALAYVCPAAYSGGDKEWFVAVLGKLGTKRAEAMT